VAANSFIRGEVGSSVDLFRTIAEIAGAPVTDQPVRGTSLRALLRGDAGATGADYAFAREGTRAAVVARPGLAIDGSAEASHVCAAIETNPGTGRFAHAGSCVSCTESPACGAETCIVPHKACIAGVATGHCAGEQTPCSAASPCAPGVPCVFDLEDVGDRCNGAGDCLGGSCRSDLRVGCNACVSATWKFIQGDELFDLSSNPEESAPLLDCSDERPEVLLQLKSRLEEEMQPLS
jgi:hypothetical protein